MIHLYFVSTAVPDYMYLYSVTRIEGINSLPNNNFLDWTKFKAFADDKLNVAKIVIYFFDRVENIMGKGENAVFKRLLSQGR